MPRHRWEPERGDRRTSSVDVVETQAFHLSWSYEAAPGGRWEALDGLLRAGDGAAPRIRS
ncbi:hypothetical protein CLV30_102182 [Haloactinopolyspora alba]|uniref:Uncharacterized protein n=1 Tax=Haloactinopolyspora alba TaxID=648780 RepID=A0A2P8EBF3_9ACTN|nr:hypothetical protein [Haloactinopolyspora alba]PSL06794.1 hypothetical protein CLV30_102182 [Haloactinopolyspora alba]